MALENILDYNSEAREEYHEAMGKHYQSAIDEVDDWIDQHIEEYKGLGLVTAEQELVLQRLYHSFQLSFQYIPRRNAL